MVEMSNRAWVGEAFAILAKGLGPFVQRHLPMSLAGQGSTNDPSDLLQAMDDRWDIVESQFPRMDRKGTQSLVRTLRHERHQWAHNRPIQHYDAQLVVSGVVKLLETVDAAAVDEAKHLMEAFIRASNAEVDTQSPVAGGSGSTRSQRQGAQASVHAWFTVDSPLGLVFVAHQNGRVSALRVEQDGRLAIKPETGPRASSWGVVDAGGFRRFVHDKLNIDLEPEPNRDPKLATQVGQALEEGRTDVPLDLSSLDNAPFHQEALRATTQIPHGELRTYQEVAEMAGNRKAHQAAGEAMRRNPVPLLAPCHRVVHGTFEKTRDVGEWGYGRTMKARLLAREGVVL